MCGSVQKTDIIAHYKVQGETVPDFPKANTSFYSSSFINKVLLAFSFQTVSFYMFLVQNDIFLLALLLVKIACNSHL